MICLPLPSMKLPTNTKGRMPIIETGFRKAKVESDWGASLLSWLKLEPEEVTKYHLREYAKIFLFNDGHLLKKLDASEIYEWLYEELSRLTGHWGPPTEVEYQYFMSFLEQPL